MNACNICFHRKIIKILSGYPLLSGACFISTSTESTKDLHVTGAISLNLLKTVAMKKHLYFRSTVLEPSESSGKYWC